MDLTIGQLATKAAINIETIRYYERRGLIKRPQKPVSGYRRYGGDILRRLLFIRRAKSIGFTLDEIANLLLLSEGNCDEIQLLAEQKLDQIRARVSDLQRLAEVLEDLVRQCNTSADKKHCPIIETLVK